MVAFDAAGDPDRFPDAGAPWQPSKLYYSGFSFRRIRRCTRRTSASARRARTPNDREMEERLADTDLPITRRRRSSTSATTSSRGAALLAHRTQVDPEGHWMRLPDDVLREMFPWEEYMLARSLVPGLAMPSEDEPSTTCSPACGRSPT